MNLESSGVERRTGAHAMTNITTKLESQPAAETAVHLFDTGLTRSKLACAIGFGEFIHAMIEGELDLALSRPRYARHTKLPSSEAEGVVGAAGIATATGRDRCWKLRPSGDRGCRAPG